MNNILIKKIDNNFYEIKILTFINIYNINALEEAIKTIITKTKKKYHLKKEIIIDIYPSEYETIVILKDYNKHLTINNDTEVKINIHTDTVFLYQSPGCNDWKSFPALQLLYFYRLIR